MNIQRWLMTSVLMLTGSQALAADATFQLNDIDLATFDFQIKESKLGGFERHKVVGGMKVRGWQVGSHAHFGQTKVQDKWGIGFVFEKGNTSYGVNHRGFQFSREF